MNGPGSLPGTRTTTEDTLMPTLNEPLPVAGLPDLAVLQERLGDRLLTDPEQVAPYCRDASRAVPQEPAVAVVLAARTADVSAALAWANDHRVPVSVRGGGTGLSGGAVSYSGGLVVSLERMNRVLDVDVANRLADVQGGVITADLDAQAREHGLFFPPDPASSRTSTVAGNIATNAGGLRGVAHGVLGDSVAALEVVLADGRVLRTGRRTTKDATGYDLVSLFVGSEGTLGVITGATVRLKPVPPGRPRTFGVSFDSIEDAGRAVTAIVASPAQPEVLEMIDALGVEIIEDYQPSGLPRPEAALLLGQTVGADARVQAEMILRICAEHGGTDATVSTGEELLEARRRSQPALVARGMRVSSDVGVPVAALAQMVTGVKRIGAEHGRRVSIVAHAGDGNLHPTVESGQGQAEYAAAQAVIDDITRFALELGGTVSGEHGIGSLKRHALAWQVEPVSRQMQAGIKAVFDPNGILTPGRAI